MTTTETEITTESAAPKATEATKRRGVAVGRYYTDKTFTPRGAFPPARFDVEVPGSGFAQKDVEAPAAWAPAHVTIAAKHYFRKDLGLPRVGLAPSAGETSVYAVVGRIVGAIHRAGIARDYFSGQQSADAFRDELRYMLLAQIGSFNTPVWLNAGLYESYGVAGGGGNYAWDDVDGRPRETTNAYERPQCSACFIQPVKDDLVGDGGIFDLVKREARLFKHGSGTGTNFSTLRAEGEPIAGGGTSSGLISFLKPFDAAAGSTKSGGVSRRSAKMVVVDADHPEIEAFVALKSTEERKIRALVAAGFSPGMDGEAARSVTGQNANNSVRVTDAFVRKAVGGDPDPTWALTARTTGEAVKAIEAPHLWRAMAQAAWESGCPGVQFDTTVNAMHTCPASGRINASNPCSEYMFLDDSACNLASLNLVKFLRDDGTFNAVAYQHAIDVFLLAQEILVDYASYPSAEICQNSHDYRPLGLGFCNLGGLLMRIGLPYDSDAGRSMAGALTAILGGRAYWSSARFAEALGPFPGYAANRSSMLAVVARHLGSAQDGRGRGGAGARLWSIAADAWADALTLGEAGGYRNAQTTLIAPTGTIGLKMGADSLSGEPVLALKTRKTLANGGVLTSACESVEPGLRALGYEGDVLAGILSHVAAHGTVEGSAVRPEHLAVFDTALGVGGRFISPEGHVAMVAAMQPFLSGAISKTVNLPSSATVEDVQRVFELAWRTGCKSITVYRDGSKGAQPMSAVGADDKPAASPEPGAKAPSAAEVSALLEKAYARGRSDALADAARGVEACAARGLGWAVRKALPPKRYGATQEVTVGGHKLFLRTSEYPDGGLGEIFVDLAGEGAPMRAWANAFAIAVSVGLQHGVPLGKLVDKFATFAFEPRGAVEGDANIKFAPSVVAYIARRLGVDYLERDDLAQVPPARPRAAEPDPVARAVLDLVGAGADPVAAAEASGLPLAAAPAPRGKAGDPCAACGSTNTIPVGHCFACRDCGATGGCS
jgi:ribonucleoside-diphosphate reductase alpha chain